MEAAENKEVIYEFGRFVLNVRERLLLLGDRPVRLRAKEFETLLLLLESNGRAVSKEELLTALWPGAFVEEGNLAKQISRLRKVFNGDGSTFIETLPKHGYRFSADVYRKCLPADRAVDEKTPSPESPSAGLKSKGYRRPLIAAGLMVLAGTTAGLVSLWRERPGPATPAKSSVVFLTDGSHDDSGARVVDGGKIYFSRRVSNSRIESWVMDPDGGNVHRANSEIKNLLHGVWSPDGKKVVFTKEGDKAIYLADSNGANEVTLPILGGNMDWSPDGSQFVHQTRVDHNTSEIFLYTLATGKNKKLTDDISADPSFSYDGEQIAFTSWRDGNSEIYVMKTDGTDVRRITNHPAFDQYPVFSPDGTAIAFQSNREDERIEVYLQDLNVNEPPKRITISDNLSGLSVKGWSADGTRLLVYTKQSGKSRIFWADVETSSPKLILSDENADIRFPRPAPDSNRILAEARLSDGSIAILLTDLESGQTRTTFKTGPNYPEEYSLSPAWSPDAKRIAFNDRASGNSEIFIIDADGSTPQNLTNHPLADTNPLFSPDGIEMIFSRDFYGKSRLYRMTLDGKEQRPLTENIGHEMNGGFSPDGSTLAFAADRQARDSRGLDIFLLNFGPPVSEKRLTNRRAHDSSPSISPDGNRVVFTSSSDGNWEIYVMNVDGSGLRRLTRNVADDLSPQWSYDGKRIIFSSGRSGRSAIYEVEL